MSRTARKLSVVIAGLIVFWAAFDSSPATGSEGTIYVGAQDRNLYAINADGSLKWKFATGASVQSSAAIASDGTIYVGSDDSNVYAIGPTPSPTPEPKKTPTLGPLFGNQF